MSVKLCRSYRLGRIFIAVVFFAASAAPALALVHAGDKLQVTVYNHPELSVKEVTVDARNRLELPLAGTINVSGLDAPRIASRITKALDPYMVKPAVDVEVTEQTSSLFISGGRGGVLKYQPGETLAAALDDVYKTNDTASKENTASEMTRVDLHRVAVQRDDATVGTYDMAQQSTQAQPGPVLQPGDTIVLVNKPDVVRVAGEVQHPGLAYLAPDETLSAALAQSGGALPSAATTNLVLQRGGSSQVLALGDPAFTQPLQNGDQVTVPVAPRVNVAGLVDKPGEVTLKTDFSLLSAIYNAGGPTKWADLANVQIVRNGTKANYNITRLTHGDLTQNPTLRDGDLVFVPEGHKMDFGSIFGTLATFLVNPLHL